MVMNTRRKQHYWATGKNTQEAERFQQGFFIEYNPNIQMYRINNSLGIPPELMGYSKHRKRLIADINNYCRKLK